MNVQYTLLGLLANAPNYGYELKKQYDGFFGKDKPILPGQVYSTLGLSLIHISEPTRPY